MKKTGKSSWSAISALIVALSLCCFPMAANAMTCADLGSVRIETVTITTIELRQAGALESNFGPQRSLPAHCRVAAVLAPSSDSHIEMELWLPENWNGKFLAVGNGGWAGSISYPAMAIGLQSGYAVASNDTGHKGGDGSFALGHPEKVVDFAWRAMHEMARHSKTLVQAYYEQPARLSYYQGCSTGGRQGLMSAQRFPTDFDAIVIGAPVNNMLALNASQFNSMKRLIENRDMALSPAKVEMLHEAVLAACEANDGVNDGFLNNPLACGFNPQALACTDGDNAACLTPAETEAVLHAWNGTFSAAGDQLYPGHARGFELGWRVPEADSVPASLQTDATRYLVYEDPEWDWREFEIERDLQLAREKAGYIEAVETDLSEFKAMGGKLIIYHGWNDPGPSPQNSINYVNGVAQALGGEQEDWLRLYMMPGMGHCAGGIGPDQADFLGAMAAWVEEGMAPGIITAARIREGRVDMTRPLCPYPAVAQWDGKGNPDDAASYSCSINP